MNRRFLLVAGAAAVAAGGYTLLAPNTKPSSLPVAPAFAQSSGNADTSMVAEMSIGNPDAKVTVIEYASFTCPHCRSFHETTFKNLKSNYIDTGKINFIYREVYFDRFGLWAGMVARCGGQERYFGITDLIYKQQSEWTDGGDPAVIADNLRKIGRTAGLSDAELNACLSDSDMAEAMVANYQKNAEADGITSTPSFVINGRKYSNMSYDDFAAAIDEELAG
jgi:protein-disulfide isomerase